MAKPTENQHTFLPSFCGDGHKNGLTRLSEYGILFLSTKLRTEAPTLEYKPERSGGMEIMMATIQEMYQQKLMSMQDAVKQIPDKALIATGFGALEPVCFYRELHTIYDRVTEVTIYGGGGMEQYPYLFDEKYRNKFFTQSNFYGGGTRAVHPYGQVSLIPMHLHACYTRYNEVWKPNVIATLATPMDKHGYFNLSLGGWEKKFLDTADVVILEIVDDMPNIPGEYEIHISDVTAVVQTDRNIPTMKAGTLTDVDIAIGNHVATLVEDGSTIQLGIGAVPDAVAQAFKTKKELGVHTEMLTSSIADLGGGRRCHQHPQDAAQGQDHWRVCQRHPQAV